MSSSSIVFGGGCFWGVQAAFDLLSGVIQTEVGYCGGETHNPTYEEVCRKNTGHIEVVKVTYDENTIRLGDLLELFFRIHNPTQTNGQGNDIGPQYMSAVFYNDESDFSEINKFIEKWQKEMTAPIITSVQKLDVFYTAEQYHQKYLDKNPMGYCHINMTKVKEFLEKANYRLK